MSYVFFLWLFFWYNKISDNSRTSVLFDKRRKSETKNKSFLKSANSHPREYNGVMEFKETIESKERLSLLFYTLKQDRYLSLLYCVRRVDRRGFSFCRSVKPTELTFPNPNLNLGPVSTLFPSKTLRTGSTILVGSGT